MAKYKNKCEEMRRAGTAPDYQTLDQALMSSLSSPEDAVDW